MPDPLSLLAADHRRVLDLVQTIGQTAEAARRRELVDTLIAELSAHAEVEEKVFYPAVAERAAGGEGFVSVSREEHEKARKQCDRLRRLKPENPDFDPAVGTLTKDVKEHVADEEMQLFPRVRDAFSAAQLDELGEAMLARARKSRRPREKVAG